METAPFLDAVETDLESMTAGDDDAAVVAGRIAGVLRSSLQLRLLDAMSQAALELSDQMDAGHVEVRLAGRDVELVYVAREQITEPPVAEPEEAGTARLTLRMPEALKAQVEAAAAREARSTNAWLVAAVKRALDHRSRRITGNRLTGFGLS